MMDLMLKPFPSRGGLNLPYTRCAGISVSLYTVFKLPHEPTLGLCSAWSIGFHKWGDTLGKGCREEQLTVASWYEVHFSPNPQYSNPSAGVNTVPTWFGLYIAPSTVISNSEIQLSRIMEANLCIVHYCNYLVLRTPVLVAGKITVWFYSFNSSLWWTVVNYCGLNLKGYCVIPRLYYLQFEQYIDLERVGRLFCAFVTFVSTTYTQLTTYSVKKLRSVIKIQEFGYVFPYFIH